MKKIVLAFAITYGLFSCEKEESTCGLIVDDNAYNYSITIRNSKTGNLKTFYLLPGDWINAHPGSDYCITNTTQW